MTIQELVLNEKLSKDDILNYFKENDIRFSDISKLSITNHSFEMNQRTYKKNNISVLALALINENINFLNAVNEQFGMFLKFNLQIISIDEFYKIDIELYKMYTYIIEKNKFISKQNNKYKDLEKFMLNTMNENFFTQKQSFSSKEHFFTIRSLDRLKPSIFKLFLNNINIALMKHLYLNFFRNPSKYFEHLYKQNSISEINNFINLIQNIIDDETLKKEDDLSSYKKLDIFSYKFLNDISLGYNKNNTKYIEEKVDFILKNNSKAIRQLEEDALFIIGKSDVLKIINENKNEKIKIFPMAYSIINGNYFLVNALLKHGYCLNSEEKTLIFSNSAILDKINIKKEEESLDKLSILVKSFEQNLLKESKTSTKKLDAFLTEINEEDKTHLFSYYEQFKETNSVLYKSNKILVDINDKEISVIDFALYDKQIKNILILVKHDYPFNKEQLYKIGEYICFFDSHFSSKFSDDYKLYTELYIKFIDNLEQNVLKTIFLKNSIKDIECGNDLLDFFSEKLTNIRLTKFEIDLILNVNKFNIILLDKLIHQENDYFFNNNSRNFFLSKNLNAYKLKDSNLNHLPDIVIKLFADLLIIDISNKDILLKKLNTHLQATVLSNYEKNSILQNSFILPESVDKVKIRRRI